MPESLDGNLQQGGGKIEIARFPLLGKLFAIKEGEEGHEVEIERRFEPAHLLSPDDLARLAGGRSLSIEQAYISVVSSDNDKKERKRIRLRRTSSKPEGSLLRVARKVKIEGRPTTSRHEFQIKFPTSDDEKAGQFEELWERHKWHVLKKTRYYITHKLPEGHGECEIHYDIHTDGRLDEFVRIEVEFNNADDEEYVREGHGKKQVLPDWVGNDVTMNDRFRSSRLAKYGRPNLYFGA